MRATLVAITLALSARFAVAQSVSTKKPGALIVTPDRISWSPAPPTIPPGARIAVLEGNPRKAGPFTMRVSFPDGYRIAPHFHPVAERVTVLQGTYRWGMGDKYDAMALQTLPAGSFALMPPGTHHFVEVKGPTVTQVSGMGPWKVMYVNAADDPRNKTAP